MSLAEDICRIVGCHYKGFVCSRCGKALEVIVTFNGTQLIPNTDYIVSEGTITFSNDVQGTVDIVGYDGNSYLGMQQTITGGSVVNIRRMDYDTNSGP